MYDWIIVKVAYKTMRNEWYPDLKLEDIGLCADIPGWARRI